MPADERLCALLESAGIEPVLVDVGASKRPPPVWEAIGPVSTYVGFEPDARERHVIPEGMFKRAFMIERAATDSENIGDADFYFTRAAHCSSLLPPKRDVLDGFLFAEEFEIAHVGRVPVTTIAAALASLGIEQLDWLKCDSQGADVRLFTSLPERLAGQVVAIDVEPGLVEGYEADDSFVDAHTALPARRFWLSRLTVGRVPRMRRETLEAMRVREPRLTRSHVEAAAKTPVWVNARYLRECAAFNDRLRYVLLGAVAIIDEQLGFVLDLVLEYERLFGRDETSEAVASIALERLVR